MELWAERQRLAGPVNGTSGLVYQGSLVLVPQGAARADFQVKELQRSRSSYVVLAVGIGGRQLGFKLPFLSRSCSRTAPGCELVSE